MVPSNKVFCFTEPIVQLKSKYLWNPWYGIYLACVKQKLEKYNASFYSCKIAVNQIAIVKLLTFKLGL
jgi:hypothetical protein